MRRCPSLQKIFSRSRELAQSVGELRALGEVTQAVNSTLDLATVLSTIVAKAVELHAGRRCDGVAASGACTAR
jgi:hypothetical protein